MMWRKAFTWVILASAIPANSPAAENVDEIIAKNIDARGGIEALTAITSARIAGMLKLDDVEGSYAVEWKKPGMFRMDYEMRGATNTQAYDGKSGWAMNAFSSNPDAENLTGRRLKRIKAKTDYIQGDLINYKEKGHKISLIGKKKIRGREAFKLKLTRSDGDVIYVFLDTETYLVFRKESKTEIHEGTVGMVTTIDDYKRVGDILIAHTVKVSLDVKAMMAHGAEQSVIIKSVDLNPEIEDARFKMPVPIAGG